MEVLSKLIQYIGFDPFEFGHPLSTYGRSSKWNSVRKAHLLQYPKCCVSGLKTNLDVHHVKPYYLFPDLELDFDNLRTISRPYHFLIGHLCNWSRYNENFDEMILYIRKAIKS